MAFSISVNVGTSCVDVRVTTVIAPRQVVSFDRLVGLAWTLSRLDVPLLL